MQYVCVHCDETFEPEAADKPRCPKCMRVHGVRALGGAAGDAANLRRRGRVGRSIAIVGVLSMLVGGSAYFAWRSGQSGNTKSEEQAELAPGDLVQVLAARGVEAGKLSGLLTADAAVERFAEQAVRGRVGVIEQARGVVAALRARAAKQAFVPWSMSDARESAPMPAVAVLAAIANDGARHELYPLEVAALGVAALRTMHVPAMLCEVFTLGTERSPLDPSGRLGYFVIALAEGKKGQPRFFDAYGGRAEQPTCDDCAILSDVEAIGAVLGIRALQRIANNEDPAAALHDADAAIKLLPTSPSVRSARGAVLLSNAASEPGQQEFEAAAQMRPDAARRNNSAMIWLAKGDAERTAREVSQALDEAPDFALAHVTLAALHLSQGEREQARVELDKAEGLDPRLPALALTWSQFYASSGETEQAIAYAQRAAQAHPRDPQPHLLLGRIYQQASRLSEMRSEARTVLALAPEAQKARMRDLVERLLGQSALDDPDGTVDPQAVLPAAGQAAGADTDTGAEPRLQLGTNALPRPGTLNPANGPSTLKLQQPGGKLRLDLSD